MTSGSSGLPQDSAPSLMARLKDETWPCHQKLEKLPCFQALANHSLPFESYVNQLRALSIIHSVLESEMASSEDQLVSAVWNEGLRKLPLLEKDLELFKPRGTHESDSVRRAALAMAAKIRLRSVDAPPTLLGYLYVLEGSTLGNSMHRSDITATFNLQGLDGCSYYASYQAEVKGHWEQFSRHVDSVFSKPSLHGPVVEAALEAFACLEDLYLALFPLKTSTEDEFHATQIKPEAGDHPVPADEREMRASLRASEAAWTEFPYYERRFGQRGKRFSDSDISWITTLTSLDDDSLKRQVEWLCRLLASRGMPTIMMEYTLRSLYSELSAEIPAKKDQYHKLLMAADSLTEARHKTMSREKAALLAEEFDMAVGRNTASSWKNTGTLLVTAAIDEKNGFEGAVRTLEDWLTDRDRFEKDWIDAVETTIRKAREAVKS